MNVYTQKMKNLPSFSSEILWDSKKHALVFFWELLVKTVFLKPLNLFRSSQLKGGFHE